MGVWDRLRPRRPREPEPPPLPESVTNPALEWLIARCAQGEPVDLVGALLEATLVMPTGGPVVADLQDFDPLLYARDQVQMVAVFTSLDRARSATDLVTGALAVPGRGLLPLVPDGFGLGVNPGQELGFELSPERVRTAVGRARRGQRATPLTTEQYQAIGAALEQVAPPGWVALDLTVVCVGPETRSRLGVRMPDGSVVKATGPVPRQVTRLLREFRRAVYRPGLGTWFTARVAVEAAGRISIEADYENAPPMEPAPEAWREELRRFPRDPEHVPDWLRARATPPAHPASGGPR